MQANNKKYPLCIFWCCSLVFCSRMQRGNKRTYLGVAAHACSEARPFGAFGGSVVDTVTGNEGSGWALKAWPMAFAATFSEKTWTFQFIHSNFCRLITRTKCGNAGFLRGRKNDARKLVIPRGRQVPNKFCGGKQRCNRKATLALFKLLKSPEHEKCLCATSMRDMEFELQQQVVFFCCKQ